MAQKDIIGLIRVSTRKQGDTKNGLDSQRADIIRWCEMNGYNLITIMEEVASGSLPLSARPVMTSALAMARKMKARVLTTRVDRCSRDSAIANKLLDKGMVFTIEMGEQSDKFVSYLNAGLAQRENSLVSERTKRGMAAAKARGVVMGNRKNLPVAQHLGQQANSTKADEFALKMRPIISGMVALKMTYKQIADNLNASGMPTAMANSRPNAIWHPQTVEKIVNRYRFLLV